MRDLREHLEKLRAQIAECEAIRDSATDSLKRELFTKLADHFKAMANELEKAIAAQLPGPKDE